MDDIKEFESGAKSSGNFPPYECLTETFIDRCARRMEVGINNYGKHNWKKGARDKEFILDRLRHARKHLGLLMREIDMDQMMRDDDAAACCVNIMMAMEYQANTIFGLPSKLVDTSDVSYSGPMTDEEIENFEK